jgi:hypothetical protein|nr:MAG TPA: hypothetical protein [Caudoviricetes sp.]
MIEVEVLINNFKDKENKNKKIEIIRNKQGILLNEGELLQKGDRYKITKERYNELSKLGIVVKAQKEKDKED